jgi:hypothetical protein
LLAANERRYRRGRRLSRHAEPDIRTHHRPARRGLVPAVLVALASATVPSAIPVATAAPLPDALYVDGRAGDVLSDGEQVIHTPVTVTPSAPSPDHGEITLTVDVGGGDVWTLWFRAPLGQALQVGTVYQASGAPPPAAAGLTVGRAGRTCEPWAGSFRVLELSWTNDDLPASVAIDYAHACYPHPPTYGGVRFATAAGIAALRATPTVLDFGTSMLGTPVPSQDVEIANIGTLPVAVGEALLGGNQADRYEVLHGCAGELDVGASCAVSVAFTPDVPGTAEPFLTVVDGTFAGSRHVPITGRAETTTTTTAAIADQQRYWPNETVVWADVEPAPLHAPPGARVHFEYDVGAGWQDGGWGLVDPESGVAGRHIVLPRGPVSVRAQFEGHGPYHASESAAVSGTIGLVTWLTLTSVPHPVELGDTLTLRATVTGALGEPIPPGTVIVRDGSGAAVGSGSVDAADPVLDVPVDGLGLGQHGFTAEYVSTGDGSPSSDTFVASVITAALEEAWEATLGDLASIDRVAAAPDGGVYVAGNVQGALPGQSAAGAGDVYVARYSSTGARLWIRQLGTDRDETVNDLTVTPAGAFVGGRTRGAFVPGALVDVESGYVARVDLSGALSWVRQDSGQTLELVGGLAPAPDGGVYVAGYGALPSTPPYRQALLRRYTTGGSIAWQAGVTSVRDGSTASAFGYGVAVDGGGVTLIGRAEGAVVPGGGGAHGSLFVRRYSHEGGALWTRQIDGPGGTSTSPGGIVASQSGILVNGSSRLPLVGPELDGVELYPFARLYRFDGSIVTTQPTGLDWGQGQCGAFLGNPRTPFSRAFDRYQSGVVGRLGADLAIQWRLEYPGSATGIHLINDAAAGPTGRVFLAEIEYRDGAAATWRVVAVSGVPPVTGCDTSKPTSSPPVARIKVDGAIASGRVPVSLTWSGADSGSGVARYELRQSTDGGSWVTVSSFLTGRSATRSLVPGHSYRFAVRAVDHAGNMGAFAYGPTFRVAALQEASSAIRYSGTWTTVSSGSFWGGKARASSTAGARATFTFTGRSVGLVTLRALARGRATVYVNGVLAATIDLRSSTWQAQRVVWSATWSTVATRTVVVRVAGTSGRPRVDMDAFVTLR